MLFEATPLAITKLCLEPKIPLSRQRDVTALPLYSNKDKELRYNNQALHSVAFSSFSDRSFSRWNEGSTWANFPSLTILIRSKVLPPRTLKAWATVSTASRRGKQLDRVHLRKLTPRARGILLERRVHPEPSSRPPPPPSQGLDWAVRQPGDSSITLPSNTSTPK